MTPRILRLIGLGLLGAAIMPPLAQANGPSVERSVGGIVPLSTDDVQLVSERVIVNFERMEADCTYELLNLSGADISFEMAFVVEGVRSYDEYAKTFKVSMKRRSIPVRFVGVDTQRWTEFADAPADSLPVWSVAIPAHATATVSIRYGVAWGGGGEGSHLYREFAYRAKAASMWAGVIQEARISFVFGSMEAALLKCCPVCVGLHAEPPDWQWQWCSVSWTRVNWEPKEDFSVALDWVDAEGP